VKKRKKSGVREPREKIVEDRKEKFIKDPKLRGEWAESVFVERASARGLAVSKPWGDSKSFDFVVGSPGRFVSVQVKSTTVEMGGGYMCTVKKNNQRYARGAFDFLAAYVIPEDVWYIVPAGKFAGRVTLILSSNSAEAKYEKYREAWDLLREAAAVGGESGIVQDETVLNEKIQENNGAKETDVKDSGVRGADVKEAGTKDAHAGVGTGWSPAASGLERVKRSMNYVRNYMERGGNTEKNDEEV
jgi:PD-(D/E)XK endonuclease